VIDRVLLSKLYTQYFRAQTLVGSDICGIATMRRISQPAGQMHSQSARQCTETWLALATRMSRISSSKCRISKYSISNLQSLCAAEIDHFISTNSIHSLYIMLFGRPYFFRSRLCHSMLSVVCRRLSSVTFCIVACITGRPQMFASTRGFSGMTDSTEPCKMLWANRCCHGNEIWAKIAYKSAGMAERPQMFAPSRGFSGP